MPKLAELRQTRATKVDEFTALANKASLDEAEQRARCDADAALLFFDRKTLFARAAPGRVILADLDDVRARIFAQQGQRVLRQLVRCNRRTCPRTGWPKHSKRPV